MSCKLEKIGENKVKFTIEVDNETLLKSENKVFNKQKGKLSIPGFRKGKISKEMAFKVYGRNVFLEDTVNDCINETYYEETKNSEVKILSRPHIEVVSVDIDKILVYTAEVAIAPKFTLGKYKNVELKKTEVVVSDEDIENVLKQEQEKNARLFSVERKTKLGDIVTIDFDGYVDGKQFQGGKGNNYPLTLGSKTFIDNFEEQLVDKSMGEDVEVNVTFPEKYQVDSLAGKKALFKVKINEIKEKQLPEINDEFASEISEFETLKDYKDDIKKHLMEDKGRQIKEEDETRVLEEVLKTTKIDLADEAIDTHVEDMIDRYARRLQYQGIEINKYLEMIGKTMEEFKKEQKPIAEKELKNSLILEEIAKIEKLEASDERVEKEMEDMAKAYGMSVEQFKKSYGNDEERKRLKDSLLFPTVYEFLYDNAKWI